MAAKPTPGSESPRTTLVTSFPPTSPSSSPRVSSGGVGANGSSIAPAGAESALKPPSPTPNPDSKASEKKDAHSPAPASASPALSASKSVDQPVRHDAPVNEQNLAVYAKVRRIIQRFLVRSPHTFVAIALTFIPFYVFNKESSFVYSATTFVGVGGTVYCLVRAVFLEIIPNWMLPRTDKNWVWRHLINITYTGFITAMFTTAVWKLPDISAGQGLFILAISFGVPYPFLSTKYPDIDKQPHWQDEMYDLEPAEDA